MSIFQFPKHIVDELPRLLPYLKGNISGATSASHMSAPSSHSKIPSQILAHIPKELLYLVPYFQKVDQDQAWLLPYYKDFTFDDTPTLHIATPSTYHGQDHGCHNNCDSKGDLSSEDDSGDDSDDSSEDEFFDCNMEFNLAIGYNANGRSNQYDLHNGNIDSKTTDSHSLSGHYAYTIVSESRKNENSCTDNNASFTPEPNRATNVIHRPIVPLPHRPISSPRPISGTVPLPHQLISSPQPTSRTVRKNYVGLDESDGEDVGNDSEYVPNGPSSSRKRKNRSTFQDRRLRSSFHSTLSSDSSSSSSAPTLSSARLSSSSTTVSLSSRSSAKSESPGQKSTSSRASKRACIKKAKQKQSRVKTAHPRCRQFDSNLLPDFDLECSQTVWDTRGRGPCPIVDCTYEFHRKRVADNKRHYLSHSKDQIWVCSVELDQVLTRHPCYRLPGHSNGGCNSTFTRKDTVIRHIQSGICAH